MNCNYVQKRWKMTCKKSRKVWDEVYFITLQLESICLVSKTGLKTVNFWISIIVAIIFLKLRINRILKHTAKYRRTLLWAVWKWLNQSRCSLECSVRWLQGTRITWGCRCRMEGALLECIAYWKALQTTGFWGLCERMRCGPILIIYTSYDVFFRKELHIGGRDDCSCVKIFSGINFLNRD